MVCKRPRGGNAAALLRRLLLQVGVRVAPGAHSVFIDVPQCRGVVSLDQGLI